MIRAACLRPVLALTGAALLLALAGCSSTPAKSAAPAAPAGQASPGKAGGPTSKAPSGPVDACKLVTPAEAQGALSKPIGPGVNRLVGPAEAQGATCTYRTTDFANGTAAGASLSITYFPHSSAEKAMWDKTWRDDNGYQAVPSLGDSAWFKGGLLNVWAGGATLSLSIVSLQTEATVDQLTSIARLALPRI